MSTPQHALRKERHFALVDGLPFPTKGSLVIVAVRNSHIATTADIYVKEVSEQAVEAMQRLEKHVEAELKKGPKSEPGAAYSAVNLQQGSWAVVPVSE